MYVHAFGAYFGLAVSFAFGLKSKPTESPLEGSTYQSDIFAMIGTYSKKTREESFIFKVLFFFKELFFCGFSGHHSTVHHFKETINNVLLSTRYLEYQQVAWLHSRFPLLCQMKVNSTWYIYKIQHLLEALPLEPQQVR